MMSAEEARTEGTVITEELKRSCDFRGRYFSHLPLLGRHPDPFDRMLVWQAIQHHLALVSRDRDMEAYQTDRLKILW